MRKEGKRRPGNRTSKAGAKVPAFLFIQRSLDGVEIA
jgi:hypothetical protein